MYEFITSEIRTITPKDANSILQYNTYQGQRGVKKSHVEDLADRMKKGMFTTGSICLAYYNGTKDCMLMDGQHTLNAIVKSGVAINAVVERVKCDSIKDMALLYQQKDGGVSRSLKDYVVAEKNALGINWHPTAASLIVSAISIINSSSHKAKSKRVEALEHYIPDGQFVVNLMGGRRSKDNLHLWRAPVVCAMILTYRSKSLYAEVFWEKVKTGEMLKNDDPQFLLRDFLMSHNSVTKPQTKPTATTHEFLYKCIYAWNCFVKGKKTKMIKYLPSYPIPTIL